MKPVFNYRISVCSHVVLALAIVCVTGSFSAWSAEPEKVTLHLPGGKFLRCDILKITKTDVLVKPEGEKEQSLPFGLITPQEVRDCYKLVMEPKNAALRFAMGSYFAKKELYAEAKIELTEAAHLDGSLKDKAEEVLKKLPNPSAPSTVKTATEPKKPDDKPVATAEKTDKSKPVPPKSNDTKSMSEGTGDSEKADEDFRKKFMHRDVPARTEAQMKEFLDKRLEDLLAKVGGKWRLIETKHFYCFSNIAEDKHKMISQQWNEVLYDLLCRVLNHKEGDKLWNNKMPIYYFDTFRQFQKFAVEIDKSPGAAYSGGYFASQGRDVHICIPFNSERYKNSPRMDEEAHGTLFHEGTHAFLQLSGEDVELSRWLHEGMAQFIEFWYESDKNPSKKERMGYLRDELSRNKGNLPTWEEMADRPRSGMDGVGYCCAYARLEFLYRNFDNQRLPQFIHLIKTGKPEKEALESVFKFSEEKLEDVYKTWAKEQLKRNFKFN